MQRVVRSSLVGLLTIASLASMTACGDKVTIPAQTTTPPGTVVHSVTVTPASATIAIGGTTTLVASVDADAGVTVRTVTWSSSDATVASVTAAGVVTGVKAGSVSIIATSAADANVKGAAAITVGAAALNPTVTISAINQNNGVTSVPANLSNAFGQLDVVLNVEPNGQQLKSVQATMTCGAKSISASQTVGNVAPVAAEAAAVPITLSFNTAAFNATTGAVALNNGQCTIAASATTASGTQSATNTTQLTLNNQDGVVISSSFAAITNAEGVATLTSATDAGGLPWRAGSVTVAAVPVLYSGRTIASVSINLPGASTPIQTVTAAPFSATWSATSTSGPNVVRLTLVGAGFEANGTTPLGVTPTVVVLDSNGNDLGLAVLNAGVPGQTTFRVDNTPPQPATTVIIPGRQASWVNAAYTFTGVGGASFGAAGTTKYVACGDGAAATAVAPPSACAGQLGVSTAAVSGTSGINGLTTFTYYAIPATSYAALTNGTGNTATACSTTGWTKITTAGDLAETTGFNAYVVRVFETDKLGNARCNDLANTNNLNNSTAFVNGTFGVDKVAPTATIIDSGSPACTAVNGCASDKQAIKTNPVPNFFVTYSDNASGFSTTPISTMLTRLAIDPATNAASTVNSAFGCPIGFSAGTGTCTTAAAGGTIAVDAGSAAGTTSNIDGYYTYTGTVLDLARNAGTTITRQVVVDRQVPIMGGIAVPATVVGGQSASFATSATDNLDLVGTNYTLSYVITPAGGAQPLNIRATGPAIGVAFDNVLTTASSFSLAVPFFVRNVASTTAGGVPQFNGVLPTNIAVRVSDGAGNVSAPGTSAINAANVPQTSLTNYTLPQASTATFNTFGVTNVATNISNCPAAGCAGGAAPANATSVVLTAAAVGSEGATFQFLNPFASVQFYYLDATGTNEWILIGSATAPSVTDNAAQTLRTFTWSLSWDPPTSLVAPVAANVIAVGVNTLGDALVSANNALIALTNP